MCVFCNQKSVTGRSTFEIDRVIESVETAVADKRREPENSEIAFFGGSFTAIPRDRMETLLGIGAKYVNSGDFKGIRISTRPDAIDEEILELLKSYGVTAIELGAQSMNAETLNLNLRGHTPEDTRRASALIKNYGFELGLQMMTGMYGDGKDGELYTAREIIAMRPDTVRIYPTIVLKDTYLEKLYLAKEYYPRRLEEEIELCAKLLGLFHSAQIPVIRLGLHSEESLENEMAAGPWHPAFRELCESRIYYDLLGARLNNYREERASCKFEIYVNPSELSKMIGNKKENIRRLKSIGYECGVKPAEDLNKYEFRIKKIEKI